jgi:murein L,D-transpeptidase YcbB/YkuD
MKHLLNFLLILFFVLGGCKRNEANVTSTTRDTTINQANAFSELTLDSTRLEKFITEQNIDDSAASQMRNFYNSRNYHFAWFTKDGLAEQARAFWNLHNSYINNTKDSSLMNNRLHEQMELLTNEEPLEDSRDNSIIETELQLTEHFFKYAHYAYAGKIDPKELQWHIPRKKVNAVKLLDSLVANKGKDVEQWEPVSIAYRAISKELTRYYNIEKAGGWGEILSGKKKNFKLGDSAFVIRQVKQRLYTTGDYKTIDTTSRFTRSLVTAVKQAQKRFGFKTNGIIDKTFIKELNVPVAKRIEQILINMERMRWMPKQPEGTRIVTNIPEFKLQVYEGPREIFNMDVVVGKFGHNTVVFNDQLKYVVFSPYWNIPRSIVQNEIQPAMAQNSNYLERNNMEQTGFNNGLPVIRQKPGGNNALGLVKFIFPNSYNIYFHDTPSKGLFNRANRAFSHGCIRVAQPKKLAKYLLQDQREWTDQRIDDAMNAAEEKWVTLKETVPVFISYFTAWVDNDGLLNFRNDIYGHDKKMAERLFESNNTNELLTSSR